MCIGRKYEDSRDTMAVVKRGGSVLLYYTPLILSSPSAHGPPCPCLDVIYTEWRMYRVQKLSHPLLVYIYPLKDENKPLRLIRMNRNRLQHSCTSLGAVDSHPFNHLYTNDPTQ